MQEQDEIQKSYEERKKAFKAATLKSSKHIPCYASGNNRKEINSRGVNPRMRNIQRTPEQVNVVVGTTMKDGKAEPVVAKVKTTSMRKIYHLRGSKQ